MYELRLDSDGRHVATVTRKGKVEAGDRLRHNGTDYYVNDVCYEGHLGSAEVVACTRRPSRRKNKQEEAES